MVWSITCVDTMKDSRDTSAPADQLDAATIQQGVDLCATLNVTHITCDVFYDYPDYMALWVDAIRATGKNVWFRSHWNAWEGDNGASATMTPADYLTATIAFIQAHPDFFEPGDILDACPEADNSSYWVTTYGADYTNGAPNSATDAFNQFQLDYDGQIQAALQGQNIVGVITGIHSLNSFWGKTIASLYPTTVRQLGYIVVDSYPEASSTDPDDCAAARVAELQSVVNARPGIPIIIGELGYSNAVDVDDATQAAVLAAEFAALAMLPAIAGMNYWVAQGTDTSGGYTHLFSGDRGAWGLRPAATTLSDFYAQQIMGGASATVTLDDETLDVTMAGERLYVLASSLNLEKAIGQRSTADFTVVDEAGAHHYEQGMPVTVTDDVSGLAVFGGVVNDDIEVAPAPGALALLLHSATFADWHYLADKRAIAYSNTDVTAGSIVRDLVAAALADEGVIIQRGVNKFSAQQSDVEQDDMSGFAPGATVTISRDTTAGNAWHGTGSLKVVTSGGAHTFEQIEIQVDASQFTPGADVTISFYGWVTSGTPTLRFFLQSNTGAIGGTTTAAFTTAKTRFTRTVTLPGDMSGIVWIGIRLDTGSPAQAVTFYMDGLQIEQASSVSDWELGSLQQSVQDGPTISEFTSNYETVAACIDALAQPANFYWQIDANKVLWFAAPGTIQAPWEATQATVLVAGASLERANPQYRNRQYVLGGTDETTSQVETRVGDGNTQAFTMSYPLAKEPTVEVMLSGGGFVAKTVGIGGVDTGKDWYWNAGKNEVFQDSAGTKLRGPTGTIDTLRVTYVGQFPVVVLSTDDAEVTAQQAREGGTTTGFVDAVVVDGTLSTRAGAFQEASGYLARFSQLGCKLTFNTLRGGLEPGQMLTVTLAAFALDRAPMLIESVRITHHDKRFWYQVSALEGPINSTWVQFFAALAAQSKAVVDAINLGSGSTVALLESFTATKSPTATFTTTVQACPVFPCTFPLTLC